MNKLQQLEARRKRMVADCFTRGMDEKFVDHVSEMMGHTGIYINLYSDIERAEVVADVRGYRDAMSKFLKAVDDD